MDDSAFFSVDRLVDFGMSMAVANQMMQSMNAIMTQTRVPGYQISTATSLYYVAIDNKPVGPLNESELAELIRSKKVNKDTLAWMPGMSAWQPIERTPAILKIVALTPPELPKQQV